MGLREEKEQLTRSEIMDAAFVLFCAQGIEPTEMMQIAKKAKVSRPTLYRYFESKDRLAEDVYLRNLEEMLIANLAFPPDRTLFELVCLYLDTVLAELKTHPRKLVYDAMYNLYASRKHIDPTTLPGHPFNIARYQEKLLAMANFRPDRSIRLQGEEDALFHTVLYPYFAYVQRLAIFSFQKDETAWIETLRQAQLLRDFYIDVIKPDAPRSGE